MSYIHILITKDDNIYFVTLPYREAKKFIESDFEGMLPLLRSKFLDAGYVVLDLNRKQIINSQCAFAIKHDLKRTGFEVFDV